MASIREVKESPLPQGEVDEKIYRFDFSAIGTPTSPVVTLYDLKTGTDVSATKLSGAASVSTTYVICPKVVDLVEGHDYRLTASCTVDGNIVSAFCIIEAEA